jgi:TatD DNase family protein
VITFKKVVELENAIKLIPLNRILSETDAPWLTPEPYRGKTNSPEYIDLIVKSIAKKLNKDEEEITNILFNNAHKLFFS